MLNQINENSPFTSKGYPFRKDFSSYRPNSLGRAFFSDGYVSNKNAFEVFDHSNILNKPNLKDEPLFYKEQEIPVYVFTTDSNNELKDKYHKLEINYSEIALFLIKEPQKNEIQVAINLGDSLLKLSNLKNEQEMENKLWTISEIDFNQLSSNFSAKQLISFLNKKNELFNEDVENVTGLKEELNYQEILDTFKILEDDFGAGFVNNEKNPNAYAHGDIELIALTAVGFKNPEIDKIYYGNWLRDFSQVIVAKTIGLSDKDQRELKKKLPKNKENFQLFKKMKTKFTHDTWVKIIELLAVYDFIYKKGKNKRDNYKDLKKEFVYEFGELTRDILGIYRPEEHIDNPKELTDESMFASFMYEKTIGKYEKKTLYHGENINSLLIKDNIKNYILNDVDKNRPSAFTYFSEQLRLAAAKGKNRNGFRNFGAALHILEDYFAHSNFVEIALIKYGFTDVYPWVQLDKNTEKIKDGKIKASKIPIVTGLFSTDDTIASITPKIAQKLFPLEIKKYEARESGDRTFFDTLIKYILEDLIDKEKNEQIKTKYVGFTYQELLITYNKYLDFIDKLAKYEKNKYVGWFITLVKQVSHYISQILKIYSSIIFNIILNSLDDAIKEEQTHSRRDYGTNPSHTQIAKDPQEHPLNGLAGLLAIDAVKDLGNKMQKCWNGSIKIETIINEMKLKYFTHPSHVDWMEFRIKEWYKDNKDKVKKAESKTALEHAHKTAKKDLTVFHLKMREIYEYIKNSI